MVTKIENSKHNSGLSQPLTGGNRVYLREVRESDINENYCRWLNDHEVNQYLETRFSPYSEDMIRSYVREMTDDPNSVLMAIIHKKTKTHIGNIKIGHINWVHRFADISLMIGEKRFWGKGYGTEAIKLAVEYAFYTLNLRRLAAGIYANNIGSIKAFKKAGFLEEGRQKEHRFCHAAYVDDVLLGIIRSR